jgi:thiosulfate/3-mercaptopyruvate sulfurtransferase
MSYTTLVDTDTLARHLDDPTWVVFDCRHDLARPDWGAAEYARSHIPGARFLHLDRDLSAPMTGTNGRHPLPDPEAIAAKLGAAGVGPATQVVLYDAQAGVYAARAWWTLRWLGHDAVAILDGGWAKWLKEDRPETAAVPAASPARFVARLRPLAVDAGFVLAHLREPAVKIVDARANDRYRGENETLDPVAGHIPGSVNRVIRENLDASGRFKPPAQLRAEWEAFLGGLAPGQVVHSCGSGVAACHNLFAMELAGLSGSRLYGGSWSEWVADPSRPVATGPTP